MTDQPARVLIIDDEMGMRELLREVLDCRGYAAVSAQDGYEALKILESQTVDLTLMDLNLAGMSGEETVRAIRESYPDHRIIIMTGEVLTNEGMLVANRHNVCGVIYKPFGMQSLLDAIGRALRDGRSDCVRIYNHSETAGQWGAPGRETTAV